MIGAQSRNSVRSNSLLMQSLTAASLLHDIGKFHQRSGKAGSHEFLGSEFCRRYLPQDLSEAAGMIALHLDSSRLYFPEYHSLKALILADWMSSGERERRKDGTGDPRIEPLTSIFSQVDIGRGSVTEQQYFPSALQLEKDILFPRSSIQSGEIKIAYKDSWAQLENELEKIKGFNPESYLITLFYLLKKYSWAIPAAVYKHLPDISLFDHSKTTCAIAACLSSLPEEDLNQIAIEWGKESHQLKDYFLLISGDISGIQNFLYTLTSKGAAKGLRGRSFYLQMLSESIAKYLLKEMKLPLANLLFCGGGHFYIIAPISEESNLSTLKEHIEERLLERHRGDLYLALGWTKLKPQDLRDKIPEKWKEAHDQAESEKMRRFSSLSMDSYEKILGPDPNEMGGSKKVCNVCKSEILRLDQSGERNICHQCKNFEEIGEFLGRTKYIIEVSGGAGKNEERLLCGFNDFGINYYYSLNKIDLRDCLSNLSGKNKIVYVLNSSDFLEEDLVALAQECEAALGFKFAANITPFDGTGIKDFDTLSKDSKGIKRLGILRMDVDSLGRIFSEGLGKQASISRISTLSTMLSVFFDGYLNVICNGEKFRDKLYVIYSGGDDLFIVGSWDLIPEVALEIYRDFRQYTCYNPNITISAGISIEKRKYPLYRAAENARVYLESAKEYQRGIKEKNAVCFLAKSLDWNEMVIADEMKESLRSGLEEGRDGCKLPRSVLGRLSAIHSLYMEGKKTLAKTKVHFEDVQKYAGYERWRWILTYSIHKTVKQNSMFEEDLKEIEKALIKNQWKDLASHERNVVEYMDIAVIWARLLTMERIE